MQILQLTITDVALYKDAEDLQKRLAEIHAPGLRLMEEAIDENGQRVSDGKLRTCFNLYSLHNWMKNFNYEGNDFFKEDLW